MIKEAVQEVPDGQGSHHGYHGGARQGVSLIGSTTELMEKSPSSRSLLLIKT